MNLPKGFDLKLSVELGELVSCAYDQFSCFEDGDAWSLSGRYELIKVLTYSSRPIASIDLGSKFEDYLGILRSLGGKRKTEMPVGFIAKRKNHVFLIFRGTMTASEWINNFNAKLRKYHLEGFGHVHDGFLGSYLNMRQQIIGAISDISKSARLHVAGHSLGSAFAAFAAIDLDSVLGRPISSLYTFGSPRIGDDIFVRAFNTSFEKKAFRIANSSDFVTEIPFPVPFANLLGGFFSHMETPVVFTIQHNDLEENHSMQTYIEALKSILRKRTFFAKIFGI